MGLEQVALYLEKEWSVISGAPFTFVVVFLLLAGVIWKVCDLWHQREKSALSSTIRSHEATIKLMEKEKQFVQTEADNYRVELAKGKTAEAAKALPVAYGDAAVKEAFKDVTKVAAKPDEPLRLFGELSQLNSDEIVKLAAFHRLREVGLADIDRGLTLTPHGMQMSTTVGTTSAVLPTLEALEQWKKKPEQ